MKLDPTQRPARKPDVPILAIADGWLLIRHPGGSRQHTASPPAKLERVVTLQPSAPLAVLQRPPARADMTCA